MFDDGLPPLNELEYAQDDGKPDAVIAGLHLRVACDYIEQAIGDFHVPSELPDGLPPLTEYQRGVVDDAVANLLNEEFSIPDFQVTSLESRERKGDFNEELEQPRVHEDTFPPDDVDDMEIRLFPELPIAEICNVDGEFVLFFNKGVSAKGLCSGLLNGDDLCESYSSSHADLADMENRLYIRSEYNIREFFYRYAQAQCALGNYEGLSMVAGRHLMAEAVQSEALAEPLAVTALRQLSDSLPFPDDGLFSSRPNPLDRFYERHGENILQIPQLLEDFAKSLGLYAGEDATRAHGELLRSMGTLRRDAEKIIAQAGVVTADMLHDKLESIRREHAFNAKADEHLADALLHVRQAQVLFKRHAQAVGVAITEV